VITNRSRNALRCKRLRCLLATPAKNSKGYYDHGEDFELEDQVAVLVELFAKTRRRPIGEISDYDFVRLAPEFPHHAGPPQHPYEDLKQLGGRCPG